MYPNFRNNFTGCHTMATFVYSWEWLALPRDGHPPGLSVALVGPLTQRNSTPQASRMTRLGTVVRHGR